MSNLPTWAGAEMIRMEDEHSVSMYASSKDAEIARLEEVAQIRAGHVTYLQQTVTNRDAEIARLLAENEWLREALRGESGDE
jgi:hypothetical protein